MTEESAANAYLIQAVHILSDEDEIAFVVTDAGGYVVEAIPQVGQDARDSDILFVAKSLEEAQEKYDNIYG